MRTDPSTNTVVIEYTDVLLLISTYIRRYKFINSNKMPDCVIVEVPQRAWDLKTRYSTECESYQVEGEPPEKWFNQAIKHELQQAPDPVEQQVIQSVPEPPPDIPLHSDEMVSEVSGEQVKLTPNQAPLNTQPPPVRKGEIESMSGEIEDFELDIAPLEDVPDFEVAPLEIEEEVDVYAERALEWGVTRSEAKDRIIKEAYGAGNDQIHSIPSGYERAEGDGEPPEPDSASDPDALEPDGNE